MQSTRRELDDEALKGDIEDITSLMHILRCCRIDREKMEAVENFIEHGEEELYHLRERMHDIMRMFIFQASRRLLLAHLLKIFNEALDAREQDREAKKEEDPRKLQKLDHLAEAVKHADEEVKKLEFWSDIKVIAESGATKGAVDEAQGWGEKWTGLDRSGPEDVISNRTLPGLDNCVDHEEHGTEIPPSRAKGKGKAKE
jgi:ATP-dependent Lon protease